MSHAHHAIDYVEITVDDLPASKEFYAAAFGWQFTDYGPEYAGIHGDDTEQGGLAASGGDPAPPPLAILYSDDLDATLEAVVSAGGSVTRPITPFPGGRRFQFADPSGNILAAWSEH